MPGRERVSDRVIGIVLGVVLGLLIVIGFLFLGSRSTIDAPSLSGDDRQTQPTATQATTPAPPAPAQPAPLTTTNPSP